MCSLPSGVTGSDCVGEISPPSHCNRRRGVLRARIDSDSLGYGGADGTKGGHGVCIILLYVNRVAKGLRRLERRHLRSRDGDRLPGSRIASLTRGAASDGELPESRSGYQLVPCERVGDGGEHGVDHLLGGSPGGGGLDSDVGRRARPWSCCPSLKLRSDFGGWGESTLSVPRLGRARNRRCANARIRRGVDESVMRPSDRATTRQPMRAPEPSSNWMQVDSTWNDAERSGDGQPRVERERRRDSIILPRAPSNPGRLTAPRPGFPAHSRAPPRCRRSSWSDRMRSTTRAYPVDPRG